MTGITGDKMLSHIGRIAGAQAGIYRPITADIFLTNYCNNRCPYCTYRRWELEGGAYSMTLAEFITYAERLLGMGVEGIILTGGGEPTVNPEFDPITEWLESHGFHYGINTNFNVLHRFRPDYLKVSLDGWSEDSYERHRGVRMYAAVRENIRAYAAWKKENSPGTSLGIQCVVEEQEDILKFYEANRDLDVDYIVFRPLESTGGSAYAGEADRYYAAREIETIEDLAKEDSRVVLNFKWRLLDAQEKSCLASWAQIALNERGEVMYCCHKPYQIIGHILDPDILEKKALTFTDMRTCDIPCRMTAPNAFIASTLVERKDACFI